MRIYPTEDNILALPVAAEEEGLIVKPERWKDEPKVVQVLAVGPDVAEWVQIEGFYLVPPYAGMKWRAGDAEVRFLLKNDLLAEVTSE